jgi:cytidine deaminase
MNPQCTETTIEKSSSEKIKQLYSIAVKAREKSHSPYSNCKVGSAILLSNGKIYSGCNVENSSYGATNCAERVAIQNAASTEGGSGMTITEIMVISNANPPWSPCGMCRQVIAEFASKNVTIYLSNLDGVLHIYEFEKIFPLAFSKSQLALDTGGKL